MRQKALFSTSALVGMLFSVSVAFTWGPSYLTHQWDFKKDKDKPKKEKKNQKAQKTQINFKSWEDVGPNNFGGRTRALVINPADGSLWAGSPGGGLWKSTNQGATWSKVSGFNENLTVSTILFANNKIYVGTGELAFNTRLSGLVNISNLSSGYLGYSGFPGRGVYVSSDNGASFSNDNATWSSACENLNSPCFDVATNPWLSVQKLVSARGKIYAATNKGLYYTSDDFATVAKDTFFMRPDLLTDPSMWVKRNSGSTQTLRGTAFSSEKNGLAVGVSGTILSTANGGYSWTTVTSGTSNTLNSIAYSTNIMAWAVGDNGTILRTDDAGATWVSVNSGVTAKLNKISFYDANYGFIAGDNGTILSTKDGGQTWTKSLNVPTTNELKGIKFIKSGQNLIGMAVGVSGTILKSTDTSATWLTQPSNTTENLNDISASPTYFYAVGNNSKVLRKLFTAVDTVKWTNITVDLCGTVNFNSAAFTTAQATGFIAGDNGVVVQTVTAGSSNVIWACQSTFTNENIIGLSYNAVTLGTAVGANGTILTSIGGTITSFNNYKNSFYDKAMMDIEIGANDELYVSNEEHYFISENSSSPFVVYTPFIPEIGTCTRVEVAVAPSNKNIVYVAASKIAGLSGVWKSTDNGHTWNRIGAAENSTFAPAKTDGRYSLSLSVDPAADDHIFLGSRQLWEYSNTLGWQRFTNDVLFYPGYTGYVPRYMHAIVFDPANANNMFIATDKEIVKSIDKGRAFSIVSKNYNTSMLYSIGLGTNVYGGQDVYSMNHNIGVAYRNNPDKANGTFNQISSGGAGLITVSKLNPQWIIHSDNAGSTLNIFRSLNKGENFENYYDVPAGCTSPSISYQSQLVYDDATSLPVGANDASNVNQFILDEVIVDSLIEDSSEIRLDVNTPYLFVHTNENVWLVTKPFGSNSDRSKWTRISNSFIANSDDRISAMAISNDTTHTLYVATKKGYIWRLKHAHDVCDVQQSLIFDPTNPGSNPMTSRWISSLTVHPNDKNTLLVTYAGYDQQSLGLGRVFVTNNVNDAAPSFRSVSDNLPDYPVYCAFFHPSTTQDWTVMLGTELGVWASGADLTNASTASWEEINTGDMQRVPVYQIAFNYWKRVETYFTSGTNTLRKTVLVKDFGQPIYLATHGRGMMMVKEAVSRETEVKPNVVSNLIKTYPNPTSGLTTVEFNLAQNASLIEINIMNIQGQTVQTTTVKSVQAGTQVVNFDTQNLASGIYVVKATAYTSAGVLVQHNKLVVQH